MLELAISVIVFIEVSVGQLFAMTPISTYGSFGTRMALDSSIGQPRCGAYVQVALRRCKARQRKPLLPPPQ
jgi:hypothetical protein